MTRPSMILNRIDIGTQCTVRETGAKGTLKKIYFYPTKYEIEFSNGQIEHYHSKDIKFDGVDQKQGHTGACCGSEGFVRILDGLCLNGIGLNNFAQDARGEGHHTDAGENSQGQNAEQHHKCGVVHQKNLFSPERAFSGV